MTSADAWSVAKHLLRHWLLPPGFRTLVSRVVHARLRSQHIGTPMLVEEAELLAKLKTLTDRHRGERCFVLGAGSSVKKQDLRKLRDELVVSVSNTFVHPDYSHFRPRYHVVPHILLSHAHYYPVERYVEWFREMELRTPSAEIFLDIADRALFVKNNLFKDRTVHWVRYDEWNGDPETLLDLSRVPPIWSVSELAITIALSLGFERIYLVGIDHDWFNGLFRYFYDEKLEHKVRPDASKLTHVDAEFQMRRHADIFRKYKQLYGLRGNIYNANADPEHYMDVFPKVDYDSLFDLRR